MATVNRAELLQIHSEVCNKARRLMERKNHDYSGGDNQNDPFLNFTRVEKLGITSTEQGFLVRMTDKVSRLITSVRLEPSRLRTRNLKIPLLILLITLYFSMPTLWALIMTPLRNER